MTKKEWKRGFLSSGFPLEFETAKVLVKNGFVIDPEFRYERLDAGQAKEFSVDLSSTLCFPTSNPNKINATLVLLIECKYRTPNKTWVFLPDINRPGFSLGSGGGTIRTIDDFSFCQIPSGPISDFEQSIPFCYKGIEIDLQKGESYDSEIRHGVSQLQYALPRLVSREILFNVWSHTEDVAPFFVLPILVTTAELRVLRKDTTLGKVENTRILDNITQKVPYLTLSNSLGPDFIAHAKTQFGELANFNDCENVKKIEERLRVSGLDFYEGSLPTSQGKALAEGEISALLEYCQFLICSFDELARTLAIVKQTIRSCLIKRKSF